MKRLFTITLLLAVSAACAQQDSVFKLHKTIRGDYSDFTIDNLGNIFLMNEDGQLKKLNPRGDSVAVFNELRRFGKVTSIDVSNPLKVLLYNKDFGTMLILDRFLSRRDLIDLRRKNLLQVKAVALAYDNGYWVFDEQEAQVKRLNEQADIIDRFTDFRQVFDSMPSPQYLVDQNKNLYMYDPAKGIYIFDYYGAFRRRIPLTGWKDFSVINNIVFGRSDEQLFRYEPGSLNLQQFTVPVTMRQALKIKIAPTFLYVLRKEGLEIYAYQR